MFSPFRMVCRMYALTHLSSVAAFSKIYKLLYIYWRAGYTYCSVRGIKLSCIYGGKSMQSGYKTSFENIVHFSLPLILWFLQQEVIILDLGPEYSFVKKGRISLSLTETLEVNKKKINDRPSAGHCFYHAREHGVIPISLFGRKGIQTV